MAATLTDAQKAYFQDMDQLFASKGWNRLTQGWTEELNGLPNAAFFGAKDMRDVDKYRERHELLQQLISLPDQVDAMREALLDPPDEGVGYE